MKGAAEMPPALLAALLVAPPVPGRPIAAISPGGLPLQLGMAAQVQVWQGQFPPPDAIERYEKVQPGAFNRIIAMAELAQATQATDTKRAHDNLAGDTRRGQWLGFAVAVLAIAAASVCAVVGALTSHSQLFWVAVAFLSLPVMAVANTLVQSARTPSAKNILKAAQAIPTTAPKS